MSALAEKLRRARETQVETGGHSFTIRRPTDAEALTLGESDAMSLVVRFTVGWSMKEIDLIPGGSPVAVEFDAEAFAEWVADQPETIGDLASAIVAAYQVHTQKRSAAEKN